MPSEKDDAKKKEVKKKDTKKLRERALFELIKLLDLKELIKSDNFHDWWGSSIYNFKRRRVKNSHYDITNGLIVSIFIWITVIILLIAVILHMISFHDIL